MIRRMIAKIKSKRKKGKEKKNGGFTLLELLAAITILAICAVPVVSVFTTAAKINKKAKIQQQAQITANSLMESAKAFSLFVFDRQCTNPSINSTNFGIVASISQESGVFKCGALQISSNKVAGRYSMAYQENQPIYAYFIEGLKQTNSLYDALIVFEKKEYKTLNLTDGTNSAVVGEQGGSGVTLEVKALSQGMYNMEYNIKVWVYKHDGEQPFLGQDIRVQGDALVMESGSKVESTLSSHS